MAVELAIHYCPCICLHTRLLSMAVMCVYHLSLSILHTGLLVITHYWSPIPAHICLQREAIQFTAHDDLCLFMYNIICVHSLWLFMSA